MALQVTDITRDASGTLRLSEKELQRLCALDITVSDTETTGLRVGENGLTEFASIRAVKLKKGKPPYRLELLHHYVLPFRPEYQDYLEACEEARASGEPLPPYDKKRYEYEIAPQALAVTGTRLLRERPDGPITGMSVMGETVEAAPFYELWSKPDAPIDIARFIRQGRRDAYYNTPFDKPFLRELIKDVQAYELATGHAYLRDEAEEEETPDPVYEQMVSDAETEYLTDIPYASATEAERAKIRSVIRENLLLDETIENSAHYQCLMHGFMKVQGGDGPRRLDDAYRMMVDPSFTSRKEHSAVEDICMAAQVACALADKLDGDIPDMAGLFGQLVKHADPKASVEVAPARSEGAGAHKKIVRGDIAIRFGKPAASLRGDAARLWKFLQAYDEATRRNSRAAPHILDMDPATGEVIINAERKSPLSLALLRKWIFFDQLQGSKVFEGFYPFDSAGVRADVVFYSAAKKSQTEQVEDVPLQSFRANRLWLEQHPALVREGLEVLRGLHAANPRLGTVMVRGEVKDGLRFIFKGHQRGFGGLVIRGEPGESPQASLPRLIEQLEPLSQLGLLPQVEALEPADEEESQAAGTPHPQSELMLAGGKMSLIFSDTMLRLITQRLPRALRPQGDGPHIVTTSRGETLTLEKVKDTQWRLIGTLDAFHDYVSVGASPQKGDGAEDAITEKPANILRDAGWILHRLSQLPGVYEVRISEEGQVVLHQQDGLSLQALNLLYRARLPFKANAYEIKLDAGQLMRDAFYWSVTLQRLQDELTDDEKKESQDQRMAAKPFLQQLHRALLGGKVKVLRVDDLQRCWVSDGHRQDDAQERYHLVDQHDSYHEYVCRDGRLDATASPIAGVQNVDIIERDGQIVALISPVVVAVYNAWRVAHGKPTYSTNLEQANMVELTLQDVPAQQEAMQLRTIAARLYELYGVTGIERLPVAALNLTPQGEIAALLPSGALLEHSSGLLDSLIQVYADLAAGGFDQQAGVLKSRFPDTSHIRPRQVSLPVLCDRLMAKSDPTAKNDGADQIAAMADRMTFYLSRLGGAEYTDTPQSLSYGSHIESDIGTLGFLTHELSRLREACNPGSAQHATLMKALDHIRMAHEKLFNFYTAHEALTESSMVLRKALTGAEGKKGQGLMATLAAAQTHALFELALNLPASAYKNAASLNAAMAGHEQAVERLWKKVNGNPEQTCQECAEIYRYHVYAQLRHIAKAGKIENKDMALLSYWVEKSQTDWSAAQQKEIALLFAGPVSEKTLALASQKLQASGIDPEPLLIQKRLMHDPYFRPTASEEDVQQEQQQCEEKIKGAYARRAQHYIRLMHAKPTTSQEVQQNAEYEQRAHTCLQKAGKTSQEIEKSIQRSARHVKSSSFLRAQKIIAMQVPLEDTKLEAHLAVIDVQGHEARARALMQRRTSQRQMRQMRKVTSALDDPYSTLKQTRALLQSVRTCQKELHDMEMVRYHALRDLAATIALMFQLPQLREGISERMHDMVQAIVSGTRHTPESYGMTQEILSSVCQTQQQILQQASQHAHRMFDQYQIAHQTLADGRLALSVTDIARWIDRPQQKQDTAQILLPEEPQALSVAVPPPATALPSETPSTTLAPQARLPRARYAQILAYGTHVMLHTGRQDMTLQWYITPSTAEQPAAMRCTIGLNNDAYDTVCRVLLALTETPMGQGCQISHEARRVALTIPAEKLPAISTLILVAQQLANAPGIKDIALMPSGMGIEGKAVCIKGTAAREQTQGYLQAAAFGLPVVRKPSLDDVLKGADGTENAFQITVHPALMSLQSGIWQKCATACNAQDAARIAAKMVRLPQDERTRFVEGKLGRGHRAGSAQQTGSHMQAEQLRQTLIERAELASGMKAAKGR